jgi:uracil-DNA glycosylase
MPATDNEIREKYLEKAIRELNQLSRELQSCEACSRTRVMPVLGSGHPQADIFLLKYVVYGTIFAKCPVEPGAERDHGCLSRVTDEFNIVQPKIIVVMGDEALASLNGLEVPLSRALEAREGEIQAFTPACDVLFTPEIDDALDEEGAKRRFWRAFRTLGRWHDDLPPY